MIGVMLKATTWILFWNQNLVCAVWEKDKVAVFFTGKTVSFELRPDIVIMLGGCSPTPVVFLA